MILNEAAKNILFNDETHNLCRTNQLNIGFLLPLNTL